MANISQSDCILTSSRRAHCGNESEVDHVFEVLFFTQDVEPSLVVHPLTEKLNWRLSSIDAGSFDLWHVKVIDKDYTFFVVLRNIETSS